MSFLARSVCCANFSGRKQGAGMKGFVKYINVEEWGLSIMKMTQHTRSRRWIRCSPEITEYLSSAHIPWTMRCGHWLVLSSNYFDKIDAFFKGNSYTVGKLYFTNRNYISLRILRFCFISTLNNPCWNELC